MEIHIEVGVRIVWWLVRQIPNSNNNNNKTVVRCNVAFTDAKQAKVLNILEYMQFLF